MYIYRSSYSHNAVAVQSPTSNAFKWLILGCDGKIFLHERHQLQSLTLGLKGGLTRIWLNGITYLQNEKYHYTSFLIRLQIPLQIFLFSDYHYLYKISEFLIKITTTCNSLHFSLSLQIPWQNFVLFNVMVQLQSCKTLQVMHCSADK